MEGREILGQTVVQLMDAFEDNGENEKITDAFVVVAVHHDDGSEHGSSYLHYRCSNSSWIFQLGLVSALVEMQESRRASWTQENDDDEQEEDDNEG
jgi:hypothetical protein